MASHQASGDDRAQIQEIRGQMARIRREIQADVSVAAEHIDATLNWRGYVRAAPWLAVGVAAGTGFALSWLLVPRHRVRVMEREHEDRGHRPPRSERFEEAVEERVERKTKTKGMLSMVLGFLAPIAMRAAQNYALKFVETQLADSPMADFMGTEEGSRVQPDQ